MECPFMRSRCRTSPCECHLRILLVERGIDGCMGGFADREWRHESNHDKVDDAGVGEFCYGPLRYCIERCQCGGKYRDHCRAHLWDLTLVLCKCSKQGQGSMADGALSFAYRQPACDDRCIGSCERDSRVACDRPIQRILVVVVD